MPTTIAQKLKIKEGYTLLTVNEPREFQNDLGDLPEDVTITEKAKNYNQVHWFVKDKAQMEKEVNKVIGLIKDDVLCWIYFPKGSSKIQTDLTRDTGWERLSQYEDLQWVSLISFNGTWSAFGLRPKTGTDKKKAATAKQRPIFDYINAATKEIRLPDDFATLLNKSKREKEFFETLSFTNKKEYVEWIVTAKREETRASRVKKSFDRLSKGWKNPANR
jgi:hypothetical protein